MTQPAAQPADSLRRFPCGQCGAKLEYAPGTSVLKCPYCSFENPIADSAAPVAELDFRATLDGLAAAAPLVEHSIVKCGACAAEVQPPERVTSFTCPFCGSNIVTTAQSATHIKPNCILPFAITREKAIDSFRSWIRSRWFAPSALKTQGRLDAAINGLYVPAWTYDADTTTAYTGQRGDAYYVTVGSGKNRQTVRRVRWSYASGVVDDAFDDVLVLASRSLPSDKAAKLEPWDLKSVVPYADDYLSGFSAECYQIDLAEGFGIAQQIMRPIIESTIRADIGGDEQRIDSVDTRYRAIWFKHLLLPVWISAYRFNNKVFLFLVNARTGEVQGQRPYSALKITLAILAGLALAVIIALIVAATQK